MYVKTMLYYGSLYLLVVYGIPVCGQSAKAFIRQIFNLKKVRVCRVTPTGIIYKLF
jgi:hypothetical protein